MKQSGPFLNFPARPVGSKNQAEKAAESACDDPGSCLRRGDPSVFPEAPVSDIHDDHPREDRPAFSNRLRLTLVNLPSCLDEADTCHS